MEQDGQLMGRAADKAWNAFMRRDRSADGKFVVAVHSTGIYCKASCPARRPLRGNAGIYRDGVSASAAGFRPCLRCRPEDAARDRVAVQRAVQMMSGPGAAPRLAVLAKAVGYAPHHFQRLFRRETGVSPAAYARRIRAQRLERALTEEKSVTEAIYEAGYENPAMAYADAAGAFGMTPGTWKKGGEGERIWFAVVPCSLGSMLVAATQRGLARVSFDEGEEELRRHFPKAEIMPGNAGFDAMVKEVVTLVDDPARASSADLPMDVRGTAFQQAVWQALRAIPAGETRTYSDIARAIGKPAAVRAAGAACGDNRLAVLIPCHRVLRSDGGLGGYAYGLDRKKALLQREKE